MFGLNKKKDDDKPKPFFTFPLEEEIGDPKKSEEMLKNVETKISALKKLIKEGASPEEYENLGMLLHGYSALLKILSLTPNKTK